MSKHHTTQGNHYRTALAYAKDCFRVARNFKITSQELRDRLETYVYSHNSYKRLTENRRAQLSGYINCLHDSIWEHMFWGVEFPDGTVVEMKHAPDHKDFPGWNWISEHNEVRCHHYWINGKRADGTWANFT